jgi:hypothetical protein
MKIAKTFARPIDRPINGVIKADQKDAESVWQELDEYVVTRELDKHFRAFVSAFLNASDNPSNPEIWGRIGVWVSGFFGSGKSHFIKILAYLLSNQVAEKAGVQRNAVDFFDPSDVNPKIHDAMFFADLKRAVAVDTDVILFNIDSKSDTSKKDPILRAFMNVLNERLGYSPNQPEIADLERQLDLKGKYEAFNDTYRELTGDEWVEQRDAFFLNADSIKAALAKTLGQSEQSYDAWIDDPDRVFNLSPETFAERVKSYLDQRGPKHRIIFLVDEIGQFIGQDGQMMVRLQTIVENLGTVCKGRAWVVVTSQEDIDAVLGQMTTSRENDFSKIQGRFKTRLSLSSANVDEVIQSRLLSKTPDATKVLKPIYEKNADILKNQLAFTNIGTTFKSYADSDYFAAIYPFAPYQFPLLQKIFEAIRKYGATGMHLARGERSMLDAFQVAAVAAGKKDIGALVPLHDFYPAIESFLDTAVKATIVGADDNPSLKPLDGSVLKAMFLIRYVEEMRGTLDNVVTLFVDQIDMDRLALRARIEESLQRLESQTLLRRNGEEFFFLTDEEREIARDIKNVDLLAADDAKAIAGLIYGEVLADNRNFRYAESKKDFQYTRLCDLHPYGTRVDGDLVVLMVTPIADDYGDWNEARCILKSGENDGQVIVKLREDKLLARELREYLQTEKFITRKNDDGLAPRTKAILKDRADENRMRKARLVTLLGSMFSDAEFFAAGKAVNSKGEKPSVRLENALTYLVKNTFPKLGYLQHLAAEPQKEVRAVLLAPDTQEPTLGLDGKQANATALKEVADFVRLMGDANRRVILNDLAQDKFSKRPYGWPEWQTILLVARLVVAGQVSLIQNAVAMSREAAAEVLRSVQQWRNIIVVKRQTVDVFGQMGPDGEDALDAFVRTQSQQWIIKLTGYKALAETGNFPGATAINESISFLRRLVANADSYALIQFFVSGKDEARSFADRTADIDNFYTNQRPVWDRLRQKTTEFQINQHEIEKNEPSKAALSRMQMILAHPEPYPLIKEVAVLISVVQTVNDAALGSRRAQVLGRVDTFISEVTTALGQVEATSELRHASLASLQSLRSSVEIDLSIPSILQAARIAEDLKDDALEAIEKFAKAKQPAVPNGPAPPPVFRKPRVVRIIDLKKTPGFLDSREDVDRFLADLKAVCDDALAANEPIDLR